MAKSVFLEGVPDAGVGAGGGEVVAFFVGGECGFGGDGAVEDSGGGGQERRGGEESTEDENAGAGEEDVVPFVLEWGEEGVTFVGLGGEVGGEIVDGDVRGDD